ncbi:hypothetical protein HII36_04420 [Nonomuraea sp. NN258]|uniref:hypothetical protein n=1 Tax=Nonomuraea antri TaxID=2730852 RepID=UPI001568FD45|nr:hypothetical protein [Nonomuraea antri]NRQ31080.1 hypothetical protein [Nonomuraea antri]
MLRRHRAGVPALVVTVLYLVALAVAAGLALSGGGLDLLWRLTVFGEMAEGATPSWPHVLALGAAGLVWAWILWQSLRGPLAGPAPELDRPERRLRLALYAAAGAWALFALLPFWPWWAAVDSLTMWVVVLLFQPVLSRRMKHAGGLQLLGAVGFGGMTINRVLDAPGGFGILPGGFLLVVGLAALAWMVLILRVQWRDDRWRRATVGYGIASFVLPVVLGVAFRGLGDVYGEAVLAAEGLTVVWLARSAHDLAEARPQPAVPEQPLPA